MPKKITKKQQQLRQKQIINRRKKQKQLKQKQKHKQIQQYKQKQKQLKQKQIQQYKKKQLQIQKQRKLYQQKRQKKLKQLRQYRKKQRQLQINRGCYSECQCNFHREDDYEYYGNCNYNNCNHYNNHHNNNNQCSCSHCGVNLPPNDVCVPSRNYQFFQLPNAPIYDIPDFGYGGGFGSGLGHDMRTPYISPHAGMDMFTGTLDAPIAPNPMYLSYPLF